MGDNEVRLVNEYFKLKKEMEEAEANNHHIRVRLINAKIEGIIFAYETYTSAHWSTFDFLLERYRFYNPTEEETK